VRRGSNAPYPETQACNGLELKSRYPVSTEENKTIMRRFFERVFNRGDLSVADEIVAPDYEQHDASPGERPGLEGLKASVTDTRTAFPDVVYTIDDLIAEGDRVVTRWTLSGTHQADFAVIPATGALVTFSAINIHRIIDSKIREMWLKYDTLNVMQQLGVIPPMGEGD
jgi:steroid delta-isomerase-like uncharacterized protein